jgi:hypothetical protein
MQVDQGIDVDDPHPPRGDEVPLIGVALVRRLVSAQFPRPLCTWSARCSPTRAYGASTRG